MNAVEIEEAVSKLAEQPFEPQEFPFAFLEAFGNKATTIKRLRSGASNKSDVGGVLQANNIHLAVAKLGAVTQTLGALKASPQTAKAKVKFILATDGDLFEAEHLDSGETLACEFDNFAEHFDFFLPLAGISYVNELRETAIDRGAARRLNRLYVELLKDNPDWGSEARRRDMNHFMARLIFCFYAEDTGIFHPNHPFTSTIEKMSDRDSSNTDEVIGELFRAMNTRKIDHEAAGIRNWARAFPYVNGGLFGGNLDVPRFSRIARSYLLHIGSLDWTKINPDIFGSMIQAVADDEERGALGMHYTSVPNILKVLNPLFLDDLREKLGDAGDNPRKLAILRSRMAKIRVFDPACGSGNFLVIAYKQMRDIEAEINRRRSEAERATDIPLTNFRGIELRDFPAEIARLALIIAEFQCDQIYRGQQLALAEFLPLNAENWITCGNALRLDWLSVCEPTGKGGGKIYADDLFGAPLDQTKIHFENEGGETYICGNPPYSGYNKQTAEQKADLESVFAPVMKRWGNLDYVAGWFIKAAQFIQQSDGAAAFVATNTICQGGQVPILWPWIFAARQKIAFAHTSFKWANLAAKNAGITVVIVGIARGSNDPATLYEEAIEGIEVRQVTNINGYLAPSANIFIQAATQPISSISKMNFGNHPYYGAALIISRYDASEMVANDNRIAEFVRPYYGSAEVINANPRMCIWVRDDQADQAAAIPDLKRRFLSVQADRRSKPSDSTATTLVKSPYRFRDQVESSSYFIAVPQTSSENRPYLPCNVIRAPAVASFKCFAIHDAPLWNMALIASRLHWVWIGTVCARLEMRFSYSNTLGWNTFPVPTLTEKNKIDLTRCAEDILLAREAHYPATIADLYDPETIPDNLREAHERNDEVLERIYIGRRFKNDTERLEKLFELYTKMTTERPHSG
ncbi:class I SAM-dependent DNA methyltransferase [Sphingorhabdus sp. IMCC26285]|uniref:site-specific DNA-methyltransferase (adenine-specific) n=1 Tax=Sphingorhabdus profundilacus TaxID=2509718 RepID=A0A6I4M706_9SPHN|nr:class I SAM-dependent DNA methyltransferase [Sphingorhabdus profundilacus]MVZ97915.1 class I SAM-dependent DNA methyltransferase [Sphingorhabdus profundilacus]